MIVVYGGTFNPPTLAHEEIVDLIITKYKPNRFIIMPVGDKYTWKNKIVSFNNRFQMLKIAFKDEKIEISTLENINNFKGTYYSLKEIKKETNDKVYFLLGADNLVSLNKWINYEKLLKEFNFIVLTRDNIKVEQLLNDDYLKYKDNFEVVNINIDLSASEFRDDPNNKQDIINKDVLKYIKENNLY